MSKAFDVSLPIVIDRGLKVVRHNNKLDSSESKPFEGLVYWLRIGEWFETKRDILRWLADAPNSVEAIYSVANELRRRGYDAKASYQILKVLEGEIKKQPPLTTKKNVSPSGGRKRTPERLEAFEVVIKTGSYEEAYPIAIPNMKTLMREPRKLVLKKQAFRKAFRSYYEKKYGEKWSVKNTSRRNRKRTVKGRG